MSTCQAGRTCAASRVSAADGAHLSETAQTPPLTRRCGRLPSLRARRPVAKCAWRLRSTIRTPYPAAHLRTQHCGIFWIPVPHAPRMRRCGVLAEEQLLPLCPALLKARVCGAQIVEDSALADAKSRRGVARREMLAMHQDNGLPHTPRQRTQPLHCRVVNRWPSREPGTQFRACVRARPHAFGGSPPKLMRPDQPTSTGAASRLLSR